MSTAPFATALLCLTVLFSHVRGAEREWTDATGRKVHGEYLGVSGDAVRLKIAGKEYAWPKTKLSAPDLQWVQEQQPPALKPGTYAQELITERMFPHGKHLATSQAKLADAYFTKFQVELRQLQPQIKRPSPTEAATYALKDHTFHLLVPEGFTNDGTWGIYLHLSPSDKAGIPTSWNTPLAKHRLIALSPHLAGNEHGEWFRCLQALDALATLRSRCQLDAKRTVIGGFSGGGFMALWTNALYPDLFAGVISHGKDFPMRKMEVSAGRTYAAAMPFLKDADWSSVANRKHPWVFVIGSQDQNLPLLEQQLPQWKAVGQPIEVIRMEGAGHVPAGELEFDTALGKILQ